jgi:hypothetical protein
MKNKGKPQHTDNIKKKALRNNLWVKRAGIAFGDADFMLFKHPPTEARFLGGHVLIQWR